MFPERFCSDDTDLNLLFCDDKDVLEYAHSRVDKLMFFVAKEM